ncbi:hypothetical protein JCM9534A_69390 [Catenuloplanes indicus JCM 9534]
MLFTVVAYVAGAVMAWAVYCIEVTVVYAGLLVTALLAGTDPGGPLAGPLMVLWAAAAGAFLTIIVLFPAVLISRAARPVSWPAALALAAALLALLTTTSDLATDPTTTWVVLAAASATPLTVYCAIVSVVTRRPAEQPPADDWLFASQS